MLVSTPETTAWDLVRYPRAGGGLDNIVTVFAELAERLDSKKLLETVVRHKEIFVAQRLGFILELIGREDLTQGLAEFVRKAPVRLLDPSQPRLKKSVARKWRLAVNVNLKAEA
ncbi:MAG: hypothetical protein HY747_12295 [Elusimicrobia bacterium]|nr:hypothetical protein [Elusimicrobiota bacterium]